MMTVSVNSITITVKIIFLLIFDITEVPFIML